MALQTLPNLLGSSSSFHEILLKVLIHWTVIVKPIHMELSRSEWISFSATIYTSTVNKGNIRLGLL